MNDDRSAKLSNYCIRLGGKVRNQILLDFFPKLCWWNEKKQTNQERKEPINKQKNEAQKRGSDTLIVYASTFIKHKIKSVTKDVVITCTCLS